MVNTPLKIVQAYQTRWMSIESVVCRILDQWLELKTHFSIVQNEERCFAAQTLYGMYQDEQNCALLWFLRDILTEVQRINKLFESNDANPTKLHSELVSLIETLVSKITIPRFNKINIFKENIKNYLDKRCHLGYKFESILQKLKDDNHLREEDENYLRERAINFVGKLIEELKSRLPENLEVMEKVSYISVGNSFSHNKPSLVPLLQFFNKPEQDIDPIENLSRIHLIE
ncbi:unnamed protein product [Psylliodes chrysocephalus]|uniref:Uncharacterized protein n=1 Tax=Psylliodes chrysocephalus TaxID=3402493 RepID=A0A9P0GFZ0_9CUCU|nr:unnamed protein product [Psylliodes chrysocephala]